MNSYKKARSIHIEETPQLLDHLEHLGSLQTVFHPTSPTLSPFPETKGEMRVSQRKGEHWKMLYKIKKVYYKEYVELSKKLCLRQEWSPCVWGETFSHPPSL